MSEAEKMAHRTPKFVVREDRSGEFRWKLVAGNGQIIGGPQEGYDDEWGARRARDTVVRAVLQTEEGRRVLAEMGYVLAEAYAPAAVDPDEPMPPYNVEGRV